ncbi:Peroxisome chaperone and import receptor [Cymbomonas tetramitiformis]|uniref:Peroxisome chaperone and import receptor n=1 Tax=Cymbomonas tetramitiformis TaxID=36881 RepID=A0AAE0G6W7_9CHLO|nr:Peroxisome chaperone and import receptor [Cymbomonas tetramitiformis]|eukprot:gene10025-11866_t
MAEADNDLDNLLDDAIEDFTSDRTSTVKVSTNEEPRSLPDAENSQPGTSAPPSLAFDPLAPPKKTSKKSKKKKAAEFNPEDPLLAGADGDLLEQLSSNLAQILGDIPQEGEGNQGAAKEDLQATLAALAQQTRENVGSGTAPEEKGQEIDDKIYSQLMEQFEQLGQGPDMEAMMESMMKQLLSKEVLYQPLKEIGDQYPTWLEANAQKLTPEEVTNYKKQHVLIQKLCDVYDNDGQNNFQAVVDLLQQMQECGQPPAELIKEMAPGVEFGADGVPLFPSVPGGGLPPELANCAIA